MSDHVEEDTAMSSIPIRIDDEEYEFEGLEVDNSKSMLQKIANLYAEQLMSDLILEVAGVSYPVHRLILCATSEVFQVMLMNREWSEWSESRIVLRESPSAASVFPHFLKYFYTGQVKISYDIVLPVLSLADKYNVKDLVTLCLQFMVDHAGQAAKRGHLVSWMQYTIACGHKEVAVICQNFVKWNVEWVFSDLDLSEVELDMLLPLMQQNDLVLHNELSLFDFAVRWVERQCERFSERGCSEAELAAHLDSLMNIVFSYIRFPMMCPKQLAQLTEFELVKLHKGFFTNLMAIALSFQSGQYERVSEVQQTERGRLLFTPRLYTEDSWGSVMAVDSFHSLPCYHTRTFMFSTKPSIAEETPEQVIEWTVDLYPKGVWFKKSMMIGWTGAYDVPEVVLRTVRLSITCLTCPEIILDVYGEPEQPEPDVRVKIAVLVWGLRKGVEHVASVVEKVHRFSAHNRVLNIDDALDFDELNTPLYTPSSQTMSFPKTQGRCPKCTDLCDLPEPKHLLGPHRDQLKIQVIILPLTDYSCVHPTDMFS